MGRKARITSADRIAHAQRLAEIIQLRLQGWTLQAIGESLNPPCSAQAVFKCVKRALERMVSEATEQARRLEALRLDKLTLSVYRRAVDGDLPAIDRCLAISMRRAKLLGLDRPVRFGSAGDSYDEGPKVRVQIAGSEELAHAEMAARALLSQGPHLA
jgi:hypothetical protein